MMPVLTAIFDGMTPLQYHGIGTLVVALMLLSGRFGPHEMRGWPSGMVNDGWGSKGATLAFTWLAWPLIAFVLILMYVIWVASLIRYLPFDIIFKSGVVIGYAVAIGGGGYWVVMIALPFLARWYRIV